MLFSVLSREVDTPKSGVKGKAAICRFSFCACIAKVMGGCICLSGRGSSAWSSKFDVGRCVVRKKKKALRLKKEMHAYSQHSRRPSRPNWVW